MNMNIYKLQTIITIRIQLGWVKREGGKMPD